MADDDRPSDRPLFGSVLARLGRADEHIERFRREATAIGEQTPFSVSYEVEDDGLRHVFRVHFGADVPWVEWSLTIGDALHNLRAVLDHLVYLMAIENTGKVPPPNGHLSAFPIQQSREQFDDKRTQRLIQDLSDEMRNALELLQPYHAAPTESMPALSLLGALNNADKHRMLTVCAGRMQDGRLGLQDVPNSPGQSMNLTQVTAPLVDGTPFVIFEFANPVPDKVGVAADFAIAPCIRHPQFPDGRTHSDIDWMFTYIRDEVGRVVETLRPFCGT